jgi:hypothetical protein
VRIKRERDDSAAVDDGDDDDVLFVKRRKKFPIQKPTRRDTVITIDG